MKEKDDDIRIIIAATIIAGFAMGFLIGLDEGKREQLKNGQTLAVKNNAAHYEVDENGNPIFTWNKPCEK